MVAVEPHLDDEVGAHLAPAASALAQNPRTRVVIMAACPRVLPAIEWIARHRATDLAAVVVPGAGEGSVLFGVPARPCAGALGRDDEVLLLPPPSVDVVGLCAVLAHGVDEQRLRFAPPVKPGTVSRVRAVIGSLRRLDPTGVRTTLPPGVMPGAEPITAETLICCGADDDARGVFLRGDEADFAVAARLEPWVRAGGLIVSAAWPTEELRAPARYAEHIRALPGLTDHALYGAGQHTERLLAHAPTGTQRPVLILDDGARCGGTFAGIPVVSPGAPDARALGAVVLSSPVHEDAMWERCSALRDGGIQVVRLYTPSVTGAQTPPRGGYTRRHAVR